MGAVFAGRSIAHRDVSRVAGTNSSGDDFNARLTYRPMLRWVAGYESAHPDLVHLLALRDAERDVVWHLPTNLSFDGCDIDAPALEYSLGGSIKADEVELQDMAGLEARC